MAKSKKVLRKKNKSIRNKLVMKRGGAEKTNAAPALGTTYGTNPLNLLKKWNPL